DWTMYPFATQNETDYFNLLDIYLDAALFPLLTEESFKQEGHRLEFEKQDDPYSSLILQGIVYSEMKGAMSSQSHIMHSSLGDALFPTVTYRFNSGGDPEKIVDLTHQQLLEFHRFYYHPSNSYFFTYGDIPLQQRLKVINRSLSEFDKIEINTAVPDEKRFTSPQSFCYHYPLSQAEDDGEKCQVALAWLTCSIQEPVEVLSLQVINLILLGHSGAPLRKKLLESKLGKSLADTTGYEDDVKETYFSVGLQAVAKNNLDKVEQLIFETLQEIVDQGIEPEQVNSALHQMELSTREISGGHYPYSLNLLFRFFGTWMHGGDPLDSVDFDKTLAQLKDHISHGNYLESQIKKYLIDNPHRVKVSLLPDTELEVRKLAEVKSGLEIIRSGLSPAEKEKLLADSKTLRKIQETKEDLSCLPTLKVADIPKGIKYVAPYSKSMEGLDIKFYDRPTNGILYFNWHFKMNVVSEVDREWLPVLGYLLTNNGADGLPYETLAKQINLYTGGFSASPNNEVNLKSVSGFQEYFSVSSKVLHQNVEKMFNLGTKILNRWDFTDLSRIQTLIGQRTNSLLTSLVQSGHSYASSMASRNLCRTSQIDEKYSGIHQIQFMKMLSLMNQTDLAIAVEKLNTILKQILNVNSLSMLVVGENEYFDKITPFIEKFTKSLNHNQPADQISGNGEPVLAPSFQTRYQNEAWLTTTPVSYVVKCFKTADSTHKDSPVLLVLSNLLRSCYLHGEIREKGGAYGGMAGYNPDEGIFSMASYRDPHLARTISVYKSAYEWIQSGSFTDRDIDETILQTCSGMDTPMSPAGKAIMEYINERKGRTRSIRENFREGVLNCSKKDLIRVGTKYLSTQPSLAAVTSAEIINRDTALLEDNKLEIQVI
ncbi:MAG: insulinase family protein, partial [SAR324 cluster bacterium]|nr:insulinase family protein [SAR324 cluster bacterium]